MTEYEYGAPGAIEDSPQPRRPDASIAAAGTSVQVIVLEAREDVVAARAARQLLAL